MRGRYGIFGGSTISAPDHVKTPQTTNASGPQIGQCSKGAHFCEKFPANTRVKYLLEKAGLRWSKRSALGARDGLALRLDSLDPYLQINPACACLATHAWAMRTGPMRIDRQAYLLAS